MQKLIKRAFGLASLLLLTACVTTAPVDTSAFKASDPKSILVLPPTNDSPEVVAAYGVWAQSHIPSAESGYYVFPASLVHATFINNGISNGAEAQEIPLNKLREIFGADAVLYLNIEEYGTRYIVINSITEARVKGRLVDSRNGEVIWEGSTYASVDSGNSSNIFSAIIGAALSQIINTATDQAYSVAGVANYQLLHAKVRPDIPYGARSPHYWRNTGQ